MWRDFAFICGSEARSRSSSTAGRTFQTKILRMYLKNAFMVRPEGFEPPTLWFVAKCSIQLSYGRTLQQRQPFKGIGICSPDQVLEPHSTREKRTYGAPGRIRTSDPLVRSQMLYPAELRARQN